jgi:hypothetical protein
MFYTVHLDDLSLLFFPSVDVHHIRPPQLGHPVPAETVKGSGKQRGKHRSKRASKGASRGASRGASKGASRGASRGGKGVINEEEAASRGKRYEVSESREQRADNGNYLAFWFISPCMRRSSSLSASSSSCSRVTKIRRVSRVSSAQVVLRGSAE